MSDASTTQPLEAVDQRAQWAPSYGKHRGSVSSHDGEAAPSGRHRKPDGKAEAAA